MSGVRENHALELLLPNGWARPRGYSQGVLTRGKWLFVAGQVGWNPVTEEFETDDFTGQVKQTLRNIVAVLREAGAEPYHLVRLTWFITDRKGYVAARREIGEAYARIIGRHYPAMSIVVVRELLENGAKVEIEATAVIPE